MINRRTFLKGLGATVLSAAIARTHGAVAPNRDLLIRWGKENGVIQPQWVGFDASESEPLGGYTGYAFFIDGKHGDDDNSGLAPEAAFSTIQAAIDALENLPGPRGFWPMNAGDVIMLLPENKETIVATESSYSVYADALQKTAHELIREERQQAFLNE